MNVVSLPFPLSWLQPLDFPHKLGICERLFSQQLHPYGICWAPTAAGIPWKLDLANPVHRWIVYGKYDGSAFLDWAQSFLPADGVIVDSGANIGQILLYLAQFVPQGRVFAFEPGREQADWLQECLTVHPQLPVELLRLGLGATTSQMHLASHGPDYIHGYWSRISDTDDGDPIQVVRLAEVMAARSVDRIDLWKLDVEGYEVPALQGAEPLLKNQQIRAIYVEMNQQQGQQVKDYLGQFGYRCYTFGRNGQYVESPVELPVWTNGLFLPS